MATGGFHIRRDQIVDFEWPRFTFANGSEPYWATNAAIR